MKQYYIGKSAICGESEKFHERLIPALAHSMVGGQLFIAYVLHNIKNYGAK